jgi:DNA-binding response OmpR family regulator
MSKILVIEDEPDQTKLIRLRLEARGHMVLLAGKAKEGIDLAGREKPDLVLLDMILPDLHGLDAAIKLKQNPATRSIPIVALSAVGSPDFTKACLQEGIAAYVRKPYEPRELFRIIEKYLRPEAPRRTTEPTPAPPPQRSYSEKLSEIEKQFSQKVPAGSAAGVSRPEPRGRQTRPVESPKRPGPAVPDRPRRKRVLIIDDDTSFGGVVSAHLIGQGYEVRLALDGISGLGQAFEKRPDLILLNLILPGGGGEAVLTNLRKSPEAGSVPIFVMSSLLSSKKLEEKARELGAQGYISKPIDPEDLLYIIESVIGG